VGRWADVDRVPGLAARPDLWRLVIATRPLIAMPLLALLGGIAVVAIPSAPWSAPSQTGSASAASARPPVSPSSAPAITAPDRPGATVASALPLVTALPAPAASATPGTSGRQVAPHPTTSRPAAPPASTAGKTSAKTSPKAVPPSASKPVKAGTPRLQTYGMPITWGCRPASARCARGVTDLGSCQVWVRKGQAANRLQDVIRHEYIHYRQCRTGAWKGKSISQIERIADAGAILLGAKWTHYTSSPTKAEFAAARRLL
jgi:hypothetical protein